MTYDDGPNPKHSPKVLANLKSRGVKATIFQLASQVNDFTSHALAFKDAGMDMAGHSYTHRQLTKVSSEALDYEITTAKKDTEKALGITMKLFRLPYGAGVNTKSVRQKIADNDMIHVFWNVDSLDWQDKNPDSIVERCLKQMKATKNMSGVILFHDIHGQSVTASDALVAKIQANGDKLCTVQGVVNQLNGQADSCE